MSGLEIAGVVLAVIPLLRFGLQAFQGDRFATLAKYQHVLGSIARELDLERAKLYNTCIKLFSPLVNEESLAELLSDPEAPGWTDSALALKVKKHLGAPKFQLYVDTLEELANRIIALREEMGLQDFQGPRKTSQRWYERAAKRLKLSIKSKKHKQLLVEISKWNESLHQLVGDEFVMAPIRPDRKSKLDAKKWESLRKLAGNLHSTLEERLACNCGHCHVAHLRLESRSSEKDLEVRFGVLFTLDVLPRGWHETEITIVRAQLSRVPTPPVSQSRTSRVTFDDEDDEQEDEMSKASTLQASNKRIEDLCEAFLNSPDTPGCMGYLEDDSNREYYIHAVYPPTTQGDDLSLAQLLSRKEGKADIPAMSSRDRYELAVLLATSVLQLHNTPWLNSRNWREDVRFVRAKGKKAPFAYIRKRINHHGDPVEMPSEPSIDLIRKNEIIFDLGIVLIELSLGKSLRSFQRPEDLGPDGLPNYLTDLAIAKRLVVNEVQDKEGPRYADTVNRCIHCIFDGIDPSLENEQFRQAFYQSAVMPLHAVRDDFLKP